MKVLFNNLELIHWYNKCKILGDQYVMLMFKSSIKIITFTYFICHIHHKLTVTFVTTFNAVIFLSSVVIEKYYISTILISINRVFFQCIHFQSKVLLVKIIAKLISFFRNQNAFFQYLQVLAKITMYRLILVKYC